MNVLNTCSKTFEVSKMAYLRNEKETVEMDFPIDTVWTAIQKAIDSLEWTVEQNDDAKHFIKTKTKSAFMSYSSVLSIEALGVTENTTRVRITAETPTTTITGIIDFGRTRERIDIFMAALSKQLKPEINKMEKTE